MTEDIVAKRIVESPQAMKALVGQELGVKEGNVRVIRHRAIERLRTCMTARPGGE